MQVPIPHSLKLDAMIIILNLFKLHSIGINALVPWQGIKGFLPISEDGMV